MSPCRRYCPPADPVAHVWQGQPAAGCRAGRFLPHTPPPAPSLGAAVPWFWYLVRPLSPPEPLLQMRSSRMQMAVLDLPLQTQPTPGRRKQDTGKPLSRVRVSSDMDLQCSCFSPAQVNQYHQPSIAICRNERRAAGQGNASSPTALTGVTAWRRRPVIVR